MSPVAVTTAPQPAPPATPAAGLPPAVKGLSLVSLFNDFASEMVYPLLPAFVTGTLGGGAALLGLLDGAADLTSAVLKVVSGRLADRPRWRGPLILGGYLTAVLVRPLIAVAGAAWQVVGFRVIDRVGKGIRTPPRDALIAGLTPPPLRGRAFGFHRGADHLGAVIGSLAAWYFLSRGFDVRRVIEWSVAPGILAFLILAVVLRGARTMAPEVPGATGAARSATGTEGRVFWTPVLALTALTFFRLPEALLLLRLQDTGVAVALVPLVWAGLHVVRSATSYPGGWLADRLGPRATIAAGGLVFAAVAAVLGLHLSPASAVVTFLALGLVAGLTESAERSMIARLSPVRTGRGFGLYHALTGATALPAGLIFGWIYQSVSGPAALGASAVGMVAAVALWLGALPRIPESRLA
ncbi:MAG TPA: MFS transporter [Gemmatimonadales bacterium]|nr:MFS transporter [Gemmatimonadales bacterium]